MYKLRLIDNGVPVSFATYTIDVYTDNIDKFDNAFCSITKDTLMDKLAIYRTESDVDNSTVQYIIEDKNSSIFLEEVYTETDIQYDLDGYWDDYNTIINYKFNELTITYRLIEFEGKFVKIASFKSVGARIRRHDTWFNIPENHYGTRNDFLDVNAKSDSVETIVWYVVNEYDSRSDMLNENKYLRELTKDELKLLFRDL